LELFFCCRRWCWKRAEYPGRTEVIDLRRQNLPKVNHLTEPVYENLISLGVSEDPAYAEPTFSKRPVKPPRKSLSRLQQPKIVESTDQGSEVTYAFTQLDTSTSEPAETVQEIIYAQVDKSVKRKYRVED
jgi:hypothetical protein